MPKHRTTNMCKCQSMKVLCILSGCPAGARKWHISYFVMLLHSKMDTERGTWGAMPSQSPSVTALPEGEPRGCVCWNGKWSVSVPICSIPCFTATPQTCAVLLFFLRRLGSLCQRDNGSRQFSGGGQRLVVGISGGAYLNQQPAGGQILVEPLAAQL